MTVGMSLKSLPCLRKAPKTETEQRAGRDDLRGHR